MRRPHLRSPSPLPWLLSAGLVALSACGGASKGELSTLRARVATLERDLAAAGRDARGAGQAAKACEARISRLERDLAQVTARLAAVPDSPPQPTGTRGGGGGVDAPRPAPACPATLPAAVRKLRRGMKLAEVRRKLVGVELAESEALTLTGAGARKRLRVAGPCFRVTFEGGRVTEVELEGEPPPERPGRSHRRRR